MARTHTAVLAALLLAVGLTAGGCGASKEAAKETPASQSAATDAAAPTDGLSGEEFLATAEKLSGTTVTLGRCSLLTTPGSDGTLPCRVLDKDGADIKDATGLPVDIFVKQSALSPDAQAVVADCDTMCTVQITGILDRSADGTDYLSMTDVALKPVG